MPTKPPANPLRDLPAIGRLLEQPEIQALQGQVPAVLVTEAARTVLEAVRQALRVGKGTIPEREELVRRTVEEAHRRNAPSLQAAINATGIILHTGLGRARLAEAAQQALQEVAASHSLLEIDRETGKRGARRDHVRALLCELTGAEDAMVVNNCAGAVLLAVTALAAGQEAIISRGELVEIGGAFRMPDIIRASGATLVEVGTTNRTRLSDYADALTEHTGLILRCHPSNFALVGFTESTPTEELVALARQHGLPMLDDQGSGALLSLAELGGGTSQGSLRTSVQAGCDVVASSGDKLLGGPQAGILLGRREAIGQLVSHPLARALRVDKFTLAALEATLRLYREPERAKAEIPTLHYLTRTEAELRSLAQRLRRLLAAVLPADSFTLSLRPERSQVGGGSLPGEDLPTVCVALQSRPAAPSCEEIVAHLRRHTPPVFARIQDNAVLFDPRTLEPDELPLLAAACRGLTGQG